MTTHHGDRRSSCTIPKTNSMIRNENTRKKQLEKRGLHFNGFVLKKLAQNLIASI